MIFPLKYNTASQEVPLGFFLDSSTGNVEQTSLTINNTDIKLWKSGATTLANKNSGGATHISNGIYYCVLDATDTNTYGPLEIFVHVSGALAFHKVCTVVNVDAYDALMSDSSGSIRSSVADKTGYSLAATQTYTLIGNVSGNVNGSVGSVVGSVGGSVASVTGSVGSVTGAVGSVAGNVSGSVNSVVSSVSAIVVSMADNVITDAAIASDAEYTLDEIAGAVWDEQRSLHTSAGTFGEYVNTITSSTGTTAADIWAYSSRTLSGNQSFTLIGNVSGNVNGSVGSVVGSVGSVAGNVSGSVASVTGNVAGSVASVVGAVGSVAGNVSGSVGSVTGAVGSVAGNVSGSVSSVVGAVGSVAGNVSGSVGSVSGLTTATIATSVWGNSSRSLSGNQSFTLIGNISGNVAGSVGSVTTVSDKTGYSLAATQTYTMIGNVSGSVASVVGNVGGNVIGSVASVTGAVGSVAGNVSGSVASVATGGITANSIATGAIDADALSTDAGTELATAVWSSSSRTLSGDQSFTLIGNVSGNVNGSVGSVLGAVGSVAGNVAGSVASVTGSVGSVAGNVSGSVASVVGAVGSVAGNVSGSVGSVVNGATLTQINSLVSSIRGSDNDSLKTISDQIDGISVSGSTPAEIWSYESRTLTTNIPTVQEIVDGVWDELMVNHTSTGTTGNQLATMGTSAGSITIDPSSIWNYATRTITGGTIDTVSGNVNGSVGSVVGAVGSVAGNVSGSVASVVNGATLTQINSLVSGIRGNDNDSLETISDQLDSSTPANIWSYSSRSLSGNQSFTLIGNVSGSVASVTSPVTVGTNNDKTNYSLSSTQTFTHIGNVSGDITGSVGSVTTINDKTGYSLAATQTYTLIGNISGNVNGSVGSVTGAVGSVAGNVSGSVASVVGSVGGSVGSVVNGATLTQINSLVSGIRGTDNDSLKTLSDQVDNITVSGATAQAIWEYTNRTLTSSGTAAIDYTQVSAAVWNALRSSYSTVGTFGEGVTVDGAITLGDIIDGVWDEQLSAHTSTGSAGKQLADTVTSSGTVYINIGEELIAGAVWNALSVDYTLTGSMGKALTSTGTAVIDAADVWSYESRTLTTSTGTGDATLEKQEEILAAIEDVTWGGYGQ